MAETPNITITISGTAYRVVEQLADTATHRSFRVECEGKPYFLKVFRKEAAAAFDEQVAALASVKADDGFLLPIETGEFNDERFVLRDWVEVDSFDVYTLRFKFNPNHIDEALAIGEKLARAVAPLHAQGIAHGRIKNENVFIDKDQYPIVADPTGTGDPRDDVRQIGLLLCRLYTRKPTLAINSRTLMELSIAKVPMNLLKVLWQAIQDQPSQRFKDAETLATALKEVPLKDHEKTVHVRSIPHAQGVQDGADSRLKWGLAVVLLIAAIGGASYYLRVAPLEQNSATSIEPELITPVAPVAIDERLPLPIRTSGWQAVQVWNFRHSPEALPGNAKTGRWIWNETGLVQEDEEQREQPYRFAFPDIELPENTKSLAIWYSAETEGQRGLEPGLYRISHVLTANGHMGNKVFGETPDGSFGVVNSTEKQVGQAMLEDTVLVVVQAGYCYSFINDRLVDSLALSADAGDGFPDAISPELLSIGRSRYSSFGVAVGEPLDFLVNGSIQERSRTSLSWTFSGRYSMPLGVEASPQIFTMSPQGISILRSGGDNMEMAKLGRIPTGQNFVVRLGVIPGDRLRSDSRGVGIDMNWFVGGQYKANVYIEWKPDEGRMFLGEAYYRGGRWQNTRLAPEQRLQVATGSRHYVLDYHFRGDQIAVTIDGTPVANFTLEAGHPASHANLRLISGYRSTFSGVMTTVPE